MHTLILALILVLSASAQTEQPAKENNGDLRTSNLIFSLEDVQDHQLIWLERTASLDYFLRSKKGDEERLVKIPTRDAQQLDRDFTGRFLKCLYELKVEEGKCEVALRLNLKGEEQEICRKEDERSREILPFLNSLTNRF